MTHSSEWLDHWNAKAGEPNPFIAVGRSRADEAEFDSLAQDAIEGLQLGPQDTLLDIGVANGMLGSRLFRGVARYVGCDYSETMLETARALIPGSLLYYANATDLPFPGLFCTKVLCANVFQYLSDEEQAKALREIHRVLKPGGRAMIAGLQHEAFKAELTKKWGPCPESSWFGRPEFVDKCLAAGFKAAWTRPIGKGAKTTAYYQFDTIAEKT